MVSPSLPSSYPHTKARVAPALQFWKGLPPGAQTSERPARQAIPEQGEVIFSFLSPHLRKTPLSQRPNWIKGALGVPV